jgi:eukaryotic-like serine/threonine-protein kinase
MSEDILLYATVKRLQTIGRYQVVRRIGRGGMGQVWLCEDPRLKRQVAIKTLPLHTQQDQKFAQRFEREAKAIAMLTHPHILPIHDYGEQTLPGGPVIAYLVMPYITGKSLAERLSFYQQQSQRMPAQEAFTLLKQAAEAIDYAHQKQIIHRDIKPSNMLLRDNDWLLLADFGIARMLNGGERLTRTGQSMGTPEYMAPEQIQGKASIASDNYSLAVIIYQIFTGRVPFRGESAVATMLLQLFTPLPPPQQFNPTLPTTFVQTLQNGLDKDPQQRPALASEFVAQLELAYNDPSYHPVQMRTLLDMPTLSFTENIATQRVTDQKVEEIRPTRTAISRRQVLFGTGVAAAILGGGALGAWGLTNNAWRKTVPQLPPQPTISARPSQTGANLPTLVLTGHTRSVKALAWANDSQTLISSSGNGQVLRWDISRLIQQPERSYGTPLYSGEPLNYLSHGLQPAWSLDGTMLAIADVPSEDKQVNINIFTPDMRPLLTINAIQQTGTESVIDLNWLPGNYLLFLTYKWNRGGDGDERAVVIVDVKQPQRRWTIAQIKRPDLKTETINNIIAPFSTTSMVRAFQYDKRLVVGEINIAGEATWRELSTADKTREGTQIASDFGFSGDFFVPASWTSEEKSIVGIFRTQDADYRRLYTPCYIKDWHENNPSLIRLQPSGSSATYFGVMGNPVSGTPGIAMVTDLGEVFLWNMEENSAPVRKLESGGIAGFIRSWAWSPDGHWLAVGYDDRYSSIVLWKL